ncbi:recombinase family protein [Povalibacter uvarum]|uniref:recombinase family protein n=1 Tax=Povalibacter uvarum TaxID=732238 RepID=UPI001621B707|nr:recombinase family protein [Povalibacter uvarum]
MRAAIYARYSTDKQSPSSITDQVRVCTEYAKKQKWRIVAKHIDDGISGTATGNRPGYLKLMAEAKAGHVDVILVQHTDRFMRSQDLAPTIKRLKFRKVRVIGIANNFDSDSAVASMQAGVEGIVSESFVQMVRARTFSALEMRAKAKQLTGGKAYGYSTKDGQRTVNGAQAKVVREIFKRHAEGASCKDIASRLNERKVPSPGSAWARTKRRASGWMASGVRAILLNPLYRGEILWNMSEWIKDPDTGKRLRRERPESEWIRHRDESARIVTDEQWHKAQRKTRLGDDTRLRSGGKAKYLFSGLLFCGHCGASYVLLDKRAYGCSSYLYGNACKNKLRVQRAKVEKNLMDVVMDDLLAPARIKEMAKRMERYYAEQLEAATANEATRPAELAALEERLARLRTRLKNGDPDMTAEDLMAVIERTEAKRSQLTAPRAQGKRTAQILPMLVRGAELYRDQLIAGIEGNAEASGSARLVLAEIWTGRITLHGKGSGKGAEVWATGTLAPGALLQRQGGLDGSGGRI